MSPEIIPYYVEINVMTLLLLIVIHMNLMKKTAYFSNEILYRASIDCTIVAIISDAVATALEGAMYPGSVVVNYILDMIYFIVSLIIPYLFWNYVRSFVKPEGKVTDVGPILFGIPFYVFTVLVIMSPSNGWVFTINELNQYSRGPLRVWHGVIAAAVLLFAFIYAIYYTKKGKLPKEIAPFMIIVPLFPLFGVVARNLVQGSNLIWSSMSIGLLIVFVNSQNSLISVDSLTGLNNRGRAAEYVNLKMSDLGEHNELFYTIIDLNYFKQINDNFGHAEGDKALKDFANILKKVCHHNKDFIARYGGDEFVLISERKIGENIQSELIEIQELVRQHNLNPDRLYDLSCSFGTASTTKANPLTQEKLLIEADRNMYANKAEYHQENQTIVCAESTL